MDNGKINTDICVAFVFFSGEVYSGGQSWICERSVHLVPV